MIIGGQGFSVLKCGGTAVADVMDAAAAAVAAVDALVGIDTSLLDRKAVLGS